LGCTHGKVLELNANDADAYYNRGVIKIGTKQRESRYIDLKKAEELGREGAGKLLKK
jgi:hypothetical protein